MNSSDAQRLADFLELTPDQRARLTSFAQGGPGAPPGGNPGRVRAGVRVLLTPSASLRQASPGKGAALSGGNDPFGALRARLSPRVRATLLQIEPRVLAWVGARQEHALRFAADPVGALREAVPELDGETLAELASLRASAARARPDLPGLDITSLRLEVAPASKGGPRQGSARTVQRKEVAE
jgi:hypothetical protein